MVRQLSFFFLLVLLSAIFPGCRQQPEPEGPQFGPRPPSGRPPLYHFAIHPLHNPAKLIDAYQPLMDHLNRQLAGIRFDLEASRDYAEFEEKYREGRPDFLLPNPWQTLQAMKAGYRVIAMAGEPDDFKGIFVVRRDSGLTSPGQLKGRVVSYPAPTALAACIMPQYFLYRHGVNVTRDLDNRYVGSQESAIMNVFLGQSAAGATWPPPWRAFQKEHPREAAELMLAWETEPLVNNSVMVRGDIPAQTAEAVRTLLVELDRTAEGRAILAGMETARFLPATDRDYEVVARFVARFEEEVRPVEQR
ncbi:MAG: phosphate/phosphite/phosphonate ABC transporter substrate-binding protein [Thermodesulfobacteriota bacterium]